MTLRTYLMLAALVGGFFMGGFLVWKLTAIDRKQNKSLKIENKEIKHEVKAYAARPRTNDDLVDRLCDRGRKQAKREGLPKREIPVLCRK